MIRKLLVAALLGWSGTAHAGWHVANSAHFIVYASGSAASARDAAVRLEKFDHVLRWLTQAKQPSSPIKDSVFLVADEEAVQATMPFGGGAGIAGYYATTMRGPYAIMSRSEVGKNNSGSREQQVDMGLKTDQVLFHEMTHHFTRQYFSAAYPTWYSEGFADYVGSMRIGADDVVTLGEVVNNRYYAFQGNDWLPVQKLLTAKSYADVNDMNLLYAEGWLLGHYLSNTKARPGQLMAFLTALNQGQPYDKAAVSAFGDLDTLNRELQNYAARGKLQMLVLPFKKIDPGKIETRPASPAEDALIGYDMRLYAGVPQAQAKAFADRVRSAASAFPDDPHALALTFEAEELAGDTAAAGRTVDHWRQVAPGDPLAICAEADARADALAAAKSRDGAAWTAVRRLYAQSLKLDPNQPGALRAFYQSYARQGEAPPESAQNALFAAHQLIPQEDDLRQEVAADFEARNMIDEALTTIRPVAFAPVDPSELSPGQRARRERDKAKYRLAGDSGGETPREMLKRLEDKKARQKPATGG